MEKVSANKMFGGEQAVYSHASAVCDCEMKFAMFTPPVDKHGEGPFPVLYWLSGLTCTEENFVAKAGAQRIAAELGVVIVAPDTSPRGDGVPDDPDGAYDFGLGAGFYVDATEAPWSANYKMYSYLTEELPALIEKEFRIDVSRAGIFGHSMGGHGALTIALKNPARYKSVSAFSPIVSPLNCSWGEKALTGYVGSDKRAWRVYDACALIDDGAWVNEVLIDQGLDDQFLSEQLKPALLEEACQRAGIPLTLRRQPGYDHSYFFVATFIEDHLRWHSERLAP